jgi:hypothetical protein
VDHHVEVEIRLQLQQVEGRRQQLAMLPGGADERRERRRLARQFVRDRRHLDGLGARADNEQDPDRL